MNEFELIQTFFAKQARQRKDVILGIGDDAALLRVPSDQVLVSTTDSFIAGVHFYADTAPRDIAHKALAVNLSDMAAMGGQPAWILLNLIMPTANETWLKDFMHGFSNLSDCYQLQLVGGDTCCGPLTITITLLGYVPINQALRRDTAQPGDKIFVTGYLGDAGLALQIIQKKCLPVLTNTELNYLYGRLQHPQPRVEIGLALRSLANSAIDLSDGLIADLSHILHASQVGAQIETHVLPLSSSLHKLPRKQALQLALTSGDDYELCFTVPKQKEMQLQKAFAQVHCPYTVIGLIRSEPGLRLCNKQGHDLLLDGHTGFQHFI